MLDLARLDDWQQQLIALANDWRCRPYAYGVIDCWQFMLAAVETQTGEVLMPGVMWPTSLAPLKRIMVARGWKDIEAATGTLLPAVPIEDSRSGDVVSFEHDGDLHMAVRVGDTALTPGPSGLVEFGRQTWRRAWKVG